MNQKRSCTLWKQDLALSSTGLLGLQCSRNLDLMLDFDLPMYRGLAKLWNIVLWSGPTAFGGLAQIA